MTTSKNIPFFPYSKVYALHEKEYAQAIDDVLKRGAFIMQRDLEEFEANLAEFTGVKHAIGVANASDALEMALQLADVGRGDEVILSSHTFIATAAAVHTVGGIPVPVDAGDDLLIDPEAVKKAITSRTKAIMPTQLNGRTCNMDVLTEIANAHGLVIVEDSAQGLGSKYNGKPAGSFGIAGSFSFYPAKVLNCFGDGGAMICSDDAVAAHIRELRDHGRSSQGVYVRWGRNSRLDNLQAAILNVNLKHYPQAIARRREIAAMYDQALRGIPGLQLPPAPDSDPRHFDIFQNYEIRADNRDALKTYLTEHGVGTLLQWGGKAIHQMRELGFTQQLPRTDALFKKLLLLPMNTMLSDSDVKYICEQIKNFYQ